MSIFGNAKKNIKKKLNNAGISTETITRISTKVRVIRKFNRFAKRTLIRNGVRPEYFKAFSFNKKFSNFDEELLINKYLETIPKENRTDFIVDIAASDGIYMSNTYNLYRMGNPGLAIEFDPISFLQLTSAYRRFPEVNLIKAKVTPDTILPLLMSCSTPKNFSVLNLDIDGYDYFILDTLLSSYRPALICTEINEKIPAPLKFTVKYDPNHYWNGDYFFGQSISQLFELCKKYDYDLVELHYNNAFLIPHEANKNKSLQAQEAYDQGYRLKKDRQEKFPHNERIDQILDMNPDDAKLFLENAFKQYTGKFELS